MIYPKKLKRGDMVRMITPSQSFAIVKEEQREIAKKRFEEELGLRISFGKHVEECDEFSSSSIQSRLEDLHEAFADPEVNGVMSIEGGFNSNQLLSEIDWGLIKNNPKVYCGYSDATVLNNAVLAKTGVVSYSSPMFSTFGMKKYFDYTLEYFKKCVMEEGEYEIKAAESWSDDDWESDQENRHLIPNEGPWVIREGNMAGRIVGGNVSSLALLAGTEYWPSLEGAVLFIEDDYEWKLHHIDRCWQGIFQQKDFGGVKGIVVGRFEGPSEVTRSSLSDILLSKMELKGLPIIANVDFGHSNPKVTLPIGGEVEIVTEGEEVKVVIKKH